MQRNRRILHLRDSAAVACAPRAVLLFGLALARPLLRRVGRSNSTPSQPLHAVLVVDNSLSMGYQKLDGTLLDEAKDKAREFIEKLPAGSRISVLPLCGSPAGFSLDAYRTKEDARDALAKIEVVDRCGTAIQAADRGDRSLPAGLRACPSAWSSWATSSASIGRPNRWRRS